MKVRKKIGTLALILMMTTTGLVGCGGKQSSETDPYKVLANKNARQAIQLAINRQELCDVILGNGSIPAKYYTGTDLVKEDGKDYTDLLKDAGVDKSITDVDKAKELWKKAKEEVGFDKVEIQIMTEDLELTQKQAEFYQAQLQDALEGLTVTIHQIPFKQQLQNQEKRNYQISMSGWVPDYPDPLTFLDTMVTGKQYAGQTGYSDKEYDKLIDQAKHESDRKKSWDIYANAEEKMLDEANLIPIFQPTNAILQKPEVKGLVITKFGAKTQFKWAEGKNKQINLYEAADIPTLDVSKVSDTTSSGVLINVMEPLCRIDEKGDATPGIAESWTTSEDGLTWTFKIRDGVKWTNGDKITAKDFEYSWKRTLDPKTKSTYGWIMYDIVGAEEANTKGGDAVDKVGVKALDDNTLEVKLVRPVTYFDKLTYDVRFLPLNKKYVESKGDKYGTTKEDTIYCGPFSLDTWKMEDQFSIIKNPSYWDASTVKLDRVNYKIVKDSNAALNLYENGDIDRVGLTADQVDKYKNDPNLTHMNNASVYSLQINASGKNGR
ncbi:MAG: ABC transporter substrate-binding protein [Clostridioides sp.]|jgi:oligopeptide transport system substrate-binding protein|nr:ABC transporter substrate-binding protein [Clostridioides sp.]